MSVLKSVFAFAFLFFYTISGKAATFTSNQDGDWSNTAIWTVTNGTDADGLPDSDDDVIIQNDHNVTLALSASLTINSLAMKNSWGSASLSVSSGSSSYILNITNGISYDSQSSITIGANVNLNSTSLAITLGGGSIFKTLATSNVNLSSSISIYSGINTIDVSGYLSTYSIYSEDNNKINVTSTGQLVVTHGMNLNNTIAINVDDGGSFDVTGNVNYSAGASSSLIITGDMNIDGNMTLANGCGLLEVNGSLDITQTLNVGYNSFTGTGSISANPFVCPEGTGTACSARFGSSITLPVKLIYFKISQNIQTVLLSWQTASEQNNHYFTIERSYNGTDFEAVATIPGPGNSSQILNYSYSDVCNRSGLVYYRLKQTDYDEKFSYSKTISTIIKANPKIVILNDKLQFDSGNMSGAVQLSICNMLGQSVWQSAFMVTDNSRQSIPVNLPTGVYFLRAIQNNSVIFNSRFIRN
jgi:hypothetical protein